MMPYNQVNPIYLQGNTDGGQSSYGPTPWQLQAQRLQNYGSGAASNWGDANTWANQQLLNEYGSAGLNGMSSSARATALNSYLRAYQPPQPPQQSNPTSSRLGGDPRLQQYGMQTGAQGYRGGDSNYPQQGQKPNPYWWMQGYQRPNTQAPTSPDFQQWGGGGHQFTPWSGGQMTAPGAWQAPQTDIPEAGVDTRARVESMRHYLDDTMAGQMGDSARQMARAGIGMEGSEYVAKLGESERSRDRDLGALYYQYDAEAAQADANRAAAARENMLNRDLGAWQTQGGWDMGAQQGNIANQFNAWQAQNQWNQNSNQMDYGAWQAQNQWAQNQYGQDMNAWQAQNQNEMNWFSQLANIFGSDPNQQMQWNPLSIMGGG